MSKVMIIVGRNCAVSRFVVDTVEKKNSVIDYSPVVPSTVVGATRINALAVVNRSLTQIAEKLNAPGAVASEPYTIYTLSLVTDMIHNGTFKFWLHSGLKSDGSEVDPVELKLWEEFMSLYTSIYSSVIFKDVSKLNIPDRPKYAVTTEQRVLAKFLKETWDRVGAGVEEMPTEETENF